MTVTSVIYIDIKVDLPSVNKKVDLPSVNRNQNFWQKFKNIIKYNIPHTPSEVGVLVSIIFSHAPEEAMSGGLAKAWVPSKNQFCSREIEFLNKVEACIKFVTCTLKKCFDTQGDPHTALLQIWMTALGPGLPNLATILFNHLIRGIMPIINRPPLGANNDEQYERLVNKRW